LEPVQPAHVSDAEASESVRERDECDRGRQREAQPRRHAAKQPGPGDADGDADLAASWAWEELAERDEIGVGGFVQPPAPGHVLLAEVAEVRHRPAKGGQPQARGDAEHLQRTRRGAHVSAVDIWRPSACATSRGRSRLCAALDPRPCPKTPARRCPRSPASQQGSSSSSTAAPPTALFPPPPPPSPPL